MKQPKTPDPVTASRRLAGAGIAVPAAGSPFGARRNPFGEAA